MTKALRKNTRRSISGSLGRYIAILLIIMLGVAFLTGLRDTRPIMSATETAYVKNTKLYDLRLISTSGFDADDVAAVQKADGVVAAAGSVNADFIWQHDNKERVYRAHMLTDNINEPVLTAGRMPENGSECLIDSNRFSEDMIGQTIEISDSNDEDTKKNFKHSTYTVVGLADSPLYIHTLRGTTSLGDGTLQGFVLIPEDGFDFEYYTELYVTCTDEFPLYSDDYDDYIDTFSDTVEAAATASVNARFDRLTSDGKAEYEDGLKDYEDGKKEFDEQISDAEQKIADAKQELADLKKPELYVLTRDTNAGYVSFESDSTIVEKLSGLFPIFFFLIAALVCSTTMTRMIDDERTQIGTLRALGYSRGSILAKYLLYSGSAAALGCVIGYFAGGYVFPFVIWTAYGMLYSIPGFVILYDPVLFVIALAASLLCSAGTTYLALRIEMQNMPANLIRPKTPAAGKRIFLERITPLWKRLKFLHKVSLRNIFRFKKRMIMMILGIAGCTALVLTGFGIHDSVANIANFQFDDIQKYDVSAQFSDTLTEDKINEVESDHKSELDAATAVQMTSGDVTGDSITKSAYIVASDDPAITDIFDLHIDGETVPYPGKGEVLLTEKLAELTDIKIGDTVTVSVSDTEKAELKVAGLVENYVQNYLYMTGETYAMVADKGYEPKTLLLRVNDSADEYALSAALSKTNGVSSVSVVTDTRNMIDQMMQSLNYVVALVLISAGALAFIVLFNLGNINLTERVREIATIKVLGFHSGETGAYVFRENIILSMMGIVVGLPLGVLLHTFVLMQIRVDMVSFKAVIAPVSFLLTVVMVVLFTVITDLVMRKKIAKIDMAESLKSIE